MTGYYDFRFVILKALKFKYVSSHQINMYLLAKT